MNDGIGALIREVSNLIVDIGDGEENALGRLYEIMAPKLLTMAKRYLWDKSLAEDVVSEVFVSVVRNANTFKDGGNGLNWLYKIAKNAALNMNRKGGSEVPILDDISDIAVAFTIDGDENLQRIALKEALLKLSEGERRLLYFRFWEGLTLRELAKTLDLPLMTLHYKLSKILKKLEGMLK